MRLSQNLFGNQKWTQLLLITRRSTLIEFALDEQARKNKSNCLSRMFAQWRIFPPLWGWSHALQKITARLFHFPPSAHLNIDLSSIQVSIWFCAQFSPCLWLISQNSYLAQNFTSYSYDRSNFFGSDSFTFLPGCIRRISTVIIGVRPSNLRGIMNF